MSPKHKPLVWLRGEVKSPPFSAEARIEAGYLLRLLQAGQSLALPRSRPMPVIGARCHELKIQDEKQTWRIIYRVDADAVVIGEVFAKTTQTDTSGSDQEQPATTEGVRRRGERMTAMEKNKRKRLEKAGWRVGSAGEFLGLTKAEEALVDMKVVLGTRLRKTREQHQMTQTDLAKRIGSSQSRVAKMEAGDPGVSLDLLVQGLLAAGATQREIASALAPRKKALSA